MTPQEFLVFANAHIPANIWALVDRQRADMGKTDALPPWPPYVFLPMYGWFPVVVEFLGKNTVPTVEETYIIQALTVAATWRVTQDVVRFDPDLYAAVINTPIDGDLPCDVLTRIPAWCIWVETQDMEFCGTPISGFWAMLDYDNTTGRDELKIFFFDGEFLHPIVLLFGEGSLKDALNRVADTAVSAGLRTQEFADDMRNTPLNPAIAQAVNLLLYLCAYGFPSRGGVVEHTGVNFPHPKKTKKGWRLFPAKRVTYHEVGCAIGAAIRASRVQQKRDSGPHGSPRPHVRRAHWHGYWHGPLKPRDGDNTPRRFDLRWLPPIPVAMAEDVSRSG